MLYLLNKVIEQYALINPFVFQSFQNVAKTGEERGECEEL
jgi:hypothetical protein